MLLTYDPFVKRFAILLGQCSDYLIALAYAVTLPQGLLSFTPLKV